MHFIVAFCTKWFLLIAVTLGYTWRLGVFLIAVILGKTMRKLRLCCQIHEWWGRGQSWPFRIFHKVFLRKIYMLAISVTRKRKQNVCSRKKHTLWGWDAKSTWCSSRGPDVSFQRPYQVSHNCLTISRPLMPSSDFHEHLHTSYITHIASTQTD